MKVQKKSYSIFWMTGALVVIGMCIGGMSLLSQNLDLERDISSLPVELESAAAIESSSEHIPTSQKIKIPIFIYHSVRPHIPNETAMQDAYDITPELFEQQLAYLKHNGYTAITLDQLAADLAAGTTSPIAKPVVLTVDDGWENQYKYAFPLLKKYQMIATFYIYTNPIGTKYFLTWDEIKEMDSAGMIIADHTLSHPYLIKLPLSQVQKEVTRSKEIIEAHLGKPVLHFASPFGYTNPDIMAIVKAAGYRTGRTTYMGAYQDNPFKLRGFLVSDRFDDFVKELSR